MISVFGIGFVHTVKLQENYGDFDRNFIVVSHWENQKPFPFVVSLLKKSIFLFVNALFKSWFFQLTPMKYYYNSFKADQMFLFRDLKKKTKKKIEKNANRRKNTYFITDNKSMANRRVQQITINGLNESTKDTPVRQNLIKKLNVCWKWIRRRGVNGYHRECTRRLFRRFVMHLLSLFKAAYFVCELRESERVCAYIWWIILVYSMMPIILSRMMPWILPCCETKLEDRSQQFLASSLIFTISVCLLAVNAIHFFLSYSFNAFLLLSSSSSSSINHFSDVDTLNDHFHNRRT